MPGQQIIIFLEILSPRASDSAHPSPLTARISKEERTKERKQGDFLGGPVAKNHLCNVGDEV